MISHDADFWQILRSEFMKGLENDSTEIFRTVEISANVVGIFRMTYDAGFWRIFRSRYNIDHGQLKWFNQNFSQTKSRQVFFGKSRAMISHDADF